MMKRRLMANSASGLVERFVNLFVQIWLYQYLDDVLLSHFRGVRFPFWEVYFGAVSDVGDFAESQSASWVQVGRLFFLVAARILRVVESHVRVRPRIGIEIPPTVVGGHTPLTSSQRLGARRSLAPAWSRVDCSGRSAR